MAPSGVNRCTSSAKTSFVASSSASDVFADDVQRLTPPGGIRPHEPACGAVGRPPALGGKRPHERAYGAERRQPLHIIGEDIFRGVLIRERKRADRSNQSFVLLVLEMPEDSRPAWRHAIEALAAVKRDTDIVGWLTRDRVLALMVPRSDVATGPGVRALEEAVRGELAKRLDTSALSRVTIGVHVHPAQQEARDSGAEPVDR